MFSSDPILLIGVAGDFSPRAVKGPWVHAFSTTYRLCPSRRIQDFGLSDMSNTLSDGKSNVL
jgi:hypothetical protein